MQDPIKKWPKTREEIFREEARIDIYMNENEPTNLLILDRHHFLAGGACRGSGGGGQQV